VSHASRPTPLVGEHQVDAVVLGAGLAGLAVALELARPGFTVVVLEAGSVGASTSGADLGHMATGLSMPYTEAIERYGRDEARSLWEHHRESHQRLAERLKGLAGACGYQRKGGFVLARDRAEALALADSEDALREDGFAGEFLDHYMLEARFALRAFSGAYWAADDGEVEPLALLGVLAEAVHNRGRLFEASPVREVAVDSTGVTAVTAQGQVRAAHAIVALGAGALPFLPSVSRGLVRLEARRLVCRPPQGDVPSPARTVDGSLGWRKGRDLRAARFTSAADEGQGGSGYEELASSLREHLGALTEISRWSGTLVSGRDGLPLIGPLTGSPLLFVLGLGTLGSSWAFVAARWIAERLFHGKDDVPSLLQAARTLAPPSSLG
jgi:glycine/D-amino acid oxidase-like deaminating enzyme